MIDIEERKQKARDYSNNRWKKIGPEFKKRAQELKKCNPNILLALVGYKEVKKEDGRISNKTSVQQRNVKTLQ